MKKYFLLLPLPLLAACAPSIGKRNVDTNFLERQGAPAGPLVDSRLAFGLSYPINTQSLGQSKSLELPLLTALAGTQYRCVEGRFEHALLPADGFRNVSEHLEKIGYTVSDKGKGLFILTRDFDVLAAYAEPNNVMDMCEVRW